MEKYAKCHENPPESAQLLITAAILHKTSPSLNTLILHFSGLLDMMSPFSTSSDMPVCVFTVSLHPGSLLVLFSVEMLLITLQLSKLKID